MFRANLILLLFIFLPSLGVASNLSQFLGGATCSTGGGDASTNPTLGTHYAEGGDPYFCKSREVMVGGKIIWRNINPYMRCADGKACSTSGTCDSTTGAIIIARTTASSFASGVSPTGGTLGGRAGADAKCAEAYNAGYFKCAQVRAVASFSASDELIDMPANYSIPTNVPIVSTNFLYSGMSGGVAFIASNWTNLVNRVFQDGYTQPNLNASVVTFSNQDGTFNTTYNCSGGTSTSGSAAIWNPYSSANNFYSGESSCAISLNLLCMCQQL